jgi:hypothetical protein
MRCPAKLLPPPAAADHGTSGSSPACSICSMASCPITVWCRQTWFSTLPSEVLRVRDAWTVCSTASLMAIPRLPATVRILGFSRLRPILGLVARAGIHRRAHRSASAGGDTVSTGHSSRLTIHTVHSRPNNLAGQRQRRAPLPRAGLGGQAGGSSDLVVIRLRHRGVRLVAAHRTGTLILVIDVRRCVAAPFRSRTARNSGVGRHRAYTCPVLRREFQSTAPGSIPDQ